MSSNGNAYYVIADVHLSTESDGEIITAYKRISRRAKSKVFSDILMMAFTQTKIGAKELASACAVKPDTYIRVKLDKKIYPELCRFWDTQQNGTKSMYFRILLTKAFGGEVGGVYLSELSRDIVSTDGLVVKEATKEEFDEAAAVLNNQNENAHATHDVMSELLLSSVEGME